jgi:hypothetical protein
LLEIKKARIQYYRLFEESLFNGLLDPELVCFILSGFIDSQNERDWSTGDPHAVHEVPLKVGVWCAEDNWACILSQNNKFLNIT